MKHLDKQNQASILIAKKIKYFGAGTLEYIVDKKQFLFYGDEYHRLSILLLK